MRVWAETERWKLYQGDAAEVLASLPPESIHCVITSPPYWRKKRYVDPESSLASLEIGQEETPKEYLERLWKVMARLHQLIRPDGTVLVNLDDTWAGSGGAGGDYREGKRFAKQFRTYSPAAGKETAPYKSMLLLPWRFVIGCQEQGWIVRSVMAWTKGARYEGGVHDRPHHAWEPIFMLTKRSRNYYAAFGSMTDVLECIPRGEGFGHIAPYPEDLIRPLIEGVTLPGDTVLDPFAGSGTTLAVAVALGRQAVGIELSTHYCDLIAERMARVTPPLPGLPL